MNALRKIFEPIAEDVVGPLEAVKVIAFDTNDTLVHGRLPRSCKADPIISQFATDLIRHQEKLGVEVAIISSDPYGAVESLKDAGLGHLLLKPVEDRLAFSIRVDREHKSCLMIDDSWLNAVNAQANVNPRSPTVRDYLGQRTYLKELKLCADNG